MKTLAVCLLMDLLGAVFAMDRAAAQTAPAAGTQLITLGTAGGPLPRADRAQSSNLLVVNGALYLIDAGGSVTSRVVLTSDSSPVRHPTASTNRSPTASTHWTVRSCLPATP